MQKQRLIQKTNKKKEAKRLIEKLMSHTCCLESCRGPRGCRGPQGKIGKKGINGKKGERGPQGSSNAISPDGAQGFVGMQGICGNSGPQGPVWYAVRGVQGRQGDDLRGVQGDNGLQGPSGWQGLVDDTGAQGFRGPQGSADDAQGPAGIVGDSGYQGPPSNLVGAQGDIGPQGFMGAQQPDPVPGLDGFEGIQGSTRCGPQGSRGLQGTDGQTYMGSQGAVGMQGPDGDYGEDGPQGMVGRQGQIGVQGLVVIPPGGIQSFVRVIRNATDQQNLLLGQSSGLVQLLQIVVTQGSGIYVICVQMSIQSLDSQITDPVMLQVTAGSNVILEETASFAGVRIAFFTHTIQYLEDNTIITLSWQEPSTNAFLGGTSIRLVLQKINS